MATYQVICELGHVMEFSATGATNVDDTSVAAYIMPCRKMVDNREVGHQTPCSARATWRRSRKLVTVRKG
jgi:hypothetical protein